MTGMGPVRWRSMVLFAALSVFTAASVHSGPVIEHFSPHALVTGERTVLTFSGSGLDRASNLWTSFGGRAERVANTNSDQISFAVNCPPDARGIGAIQLIGPTGASNFQLIMADHLRTQAPPNNHRKPETAHRITVPAAVDCVLKSEEIDYYKLTAKAGQIFSIEVIAHRIGSQMDPVIRVLDSRGYELAYCDDEGGVWKDARFQFTAPTEGDYLIAVHDVGYGGGSGYDYRLRITDQPIIWYTFPLIDSAESTAKVEVIGEGARALIFDSPANPSTAPIFSSVPQIIEMESRVDSTNLQSFAVPCLLHGRFSSGSDTDRFQFAATNGQKIRFQSQTRSLGSPADVRLKITRLDGTLITENDSGGAGEAALTNTFSEAGEFILEVGELSGTAPANAPYRIEAEEAARGFSLSGENNVIEIEPGKTARLKITATRYDYDGPIEIQIDAPPQEIRLENHVVLEKKNETELTFHCSTNLPPGTFYHLKLLGSAPKIEPQFVTTKPALRKAFPLMLNPPHVLEGVITLAVKSE
jgi:hypothetical protein